jgi:butyryl-CoA dehydrogenase
MIHEGTHGIQAMDLLGRKVLLEHGKGLKILGERMHATMAQAHDATTQAHAQALQHAWQEVVQASHLAWQGDNPTLSLANAVPFMQAFGHTVLAWIWLDVAMSSTGDDAAHLGRRQACRFFYHYELPKIGAWLQVVRTRDATCVNMPEDAF